MNCFGQKLSQSPPCATDELMSQLIKDNSKIQERLARIDKDLSNLPVLSKSAHMVMLTIPVVVYVVHDNQPLGIGSNISDNQVNSQITALNNYFNPYGVKFCLATKAGDLAYIPTSSTTHVQNTPGIIHVNNANLSNHNIQSEQEALMETAHPKITKTKYLRIWVVNSIDGQDSGINGYSILPGMYSNFDGVVIRNNVFGDISSCPTCDLIPRYSQGKILVHELGHYLGLYHTFHEECSGMNSTTCSYQGDRVCDTPPVAAPNYTCISGINSCQESSPDLPDNINNFMDYGDNECVNEFTEGQKTRMINALTLFRNELFSDPNIIYTGTCSSDQIISAVFEPNKYYVCLGESIDFNSLTQDYVSYSWNFGDPISGINNTSNLQNPSHTFSSSTNSSFTVSLTVSNESESVRYTLPIYVSECNPIQNSNSYWYLSQSSGLSFSSGRAVFDPNFPLYNQATNTCIVQNNEAGELLFYSNESNIWNKQHQLIASTLPAEAKYQSQIVLPKPGNPTKYVIFKNARLSLNEYGFTYSVINTNSNTALMELQDQPITVPSNLGYDTSPITGGLMNDGQITAIKSCNGFWIITALQKGINTYLVVYSLTDNPTNNGLSFIREYQLPHSYYPTFGINASPNGNKITIGRIEYDGNTFNNKIYLFDFNKITGELNNPISINLGDQENGNGRITSFSPDSNLLYTVGYKSISQYNLNSANVLNSKIQVSTIPYGYEAGNLQIGPNGKIYLSDSLNNNLMIIHSPNQVCSPSNFNACGFSLHGPKISNASWMVSYSLPNIINAKAATVFDNTISSYSVSCNNYKFFPNVCGNNFIWDFGDPNSGSNNSSTLANPLHIFSSNGNFTIILKNNNNVVLATTILNIGTLTAEIAGNSSACTSNSNFNTTNNSITLSERQRVTWSITQGTGVVMGMNDQTDVTVRWSSLPGIITATIIDEKGCINTVTKTILSDCITPNLCSANLAFNNAQQLNADYQASENIVLNTNYSLNAGTEISLKAGNSILISPNAHIKTGSIFLADIGPCIETNAKKHSGNTKTDLKTINKVLIYPNPTSGVVNIELENASMTEITLNSIEGKLIHFKKTANVSYYSLDLSSYEKGIYLLNLKTSEGEFIVKKIIKQ